MPRLKVNPKLLPVKAHYFFFSAGGAVIFPFLPLIGRQMGISTTSVGIIYTAAQTLTFFAKPTIGLIADRLKKRKFMLMVVVLAGLFATVPISFLPQTGLGHPVTFECGNIGTNYIKQCGSHCTEAEQNILESIKQGKPIHSTDYFHPDGRTNASSTEVAVRQIIEEKCHVRCEIPSGHDRVSFCRNFDLDKKYLPEFCRSPVESSEFEFEVILKISSTTLLESCLFLPMEGVTFQPTNQDYQQFACLPNKTELTTCFADCPNNTYLNKHLERIVEDQVKFGSLPFWIFGLLVCFSYCSFSVGNSMSDTLCFQTLGDKPQNYGMQRQWGAIGWGTFILIAGFLIDTGSKGQIMKNYAPCFYMMVGLLVLDLVVMFKWQITEMEKPKSIGKNIRNLLGDPRVLLFLMVCTIMGMCTSMHWNFLFWHVETLAAEDCDTMRWIKVLQGLMSSVQCFAEIPFFYFAGWFTKKLGYVNCFTLVLGTFGIRFVLYSVLTHPWAFIPMELFQGLTYGVFYSNMVAYAGIISPPGASATVQGLAGAAFEGIGMATGSLLAGTLFGVVGGRMAFLIFGIGSLTFCAIHAITMFFLDKRPVYSVPISTTEEPEGEEMFNVDGKNRHSQEVYLSD